MRVLSRALAHLQYHPLLGVAASVFSLAPSPGSCLRYPRQMMHGNVLFHMIRCMVCILLYSRSVHIEHRLHHRRSFHRIPPHFTTPTPVIHWKKCVCPKHCETVTKIYRNAVSWLWKGDKSLWIKDPLSLLSQGICNLLAARKLLEWHIVYMVSNIQWMLVIMLIFRLNGSVSTVLVGSLLEGERILS